MGWLTGLEPATPGTTNQCSNQLSYSHHTEKESDGSFNEVAYAHFHRELVNSWFLFFQTYFICMISAGERRAR